jgi:hypothetical protein
MLSTSGNGGIAPNQDQRRDCRDSRRTPASDITTEALFERYKRHQKARIRPTTYERLGGILDALKDRLPAQAKAITKRTVAEYIEAHSTDDKMKPTTVART